MITIKLARALGVREMTRLQLHIMTGIRPNTISDYCNNMTERINLEHFDLFCEALDCELDELLERTPGKMARSPVYNAYRKIKKAEMVEEK